jgi:uncharacterized membrane protein YphA (DoxX/SURF4 family)
MTPEHRAIGHDPVNFFRRAEPAVFFAGRVQFDRAATSSLQNRSRTGRQGAITMNSKTISYWATTGIVAFVLISGGAAQIARLPQNVEGVLHLGYPVYFITLIGVWKVLGGIALVMPKFPRLKEWAYAGTFFELTGASISHIASDDTAWHVLVPLLFAALAIISWSLRPASRTLAPLSAASVVEQTQARAESSAVT